MKKVILISLLNLIGHSGYASTTLYCAGSTGDNKWGLPDNQQVVFRDTLEIKCKSVSIDHVTIGDSASTFSGIEVNASAHRYSLKISGHGLGFRYTMTEALTLFCPTVRRHAL